MSEDDMVERVARAISDWDGNDPDDLYCKEPYWRRYEEGARAAIEAMREPTEAILRAMWNQIDFAREWTSVSWDERPTKDQTSEKEDIRDAYRAMIEAALNSPSGHPRRRPARS